MQEQLGLIELGQQFGISALLFVIFIVYHRGEVKRWTQREQSQAALYQSIITQIKDHREDEFKLLNDTLADNRAQLGMLKETLVHIENLGKSSTQAFHDMFQELRSHTANRCINELNRQHS